MGNPLDGITAAIGAASDPPFSFWSNMNVVSNNLDGTIIVFGQQFHDLKGIMHMDHVATCKLAPLSTKILMIQLQNSIAEYEKHNGEIKVPPEALGKMGGMVKEQ